MHIVIGASDEFLSPTWILGPSVIPATWAKMHKIQFAMGGQIESTQKAPSAAHHGSNPRVPTGVLPA